MMNLKLTGDLSWRNADLRGFYVDSLCSAVIFNFMEDKEIKTNLEELSRALSRVDDPALIYRFLECLLTPNEMSEVASRWALVKMLDDGISQRSIASSLGLSLCKITRGSKELQKDDSAFKKMIDIS